MARGGALDCVFSRKAEKLVPDITPSVCKAVTLALIKRYRREQFGCNRRVGHGQLPASNRRGGVVLDGLTKMFEVPLTTSLLHSDSSHQAGIGARCGVHGGAPQNFDGTSPINY